jgi:CMP-N-acetylneuraminic acid synthetase
MGKTQFIMLQQAVQIFTDNKYKSLVSDTKQRVDAYKVKWQFVSYMFDVDKWATL